MSRKLLQAAGLAAVLLTGTIFYFRGGKDSTPAASPDSETRETLQEVERESRNHQAGKGGQTVSPADQNFSPSQLLDEAMRVLPTLPQKERDAFVANLIQQLRAAGAPGLKAVVDYLRTGRDLPLREGYGVSGNRVTSASTLRVALLDALANWEGSAGVMLEFLRGPASAWELILAIRNLELQFPSVYRAEAVAALKTALARPIETSFGEGGEIHLFATVSRLKAVELLPQAEAIAVATSNVPRYLELLNGVPSDAREAALQRVLSRPEVTEEIVAAPQTVNQWSFGEPGARAFIAGIFRSRLVPEQRVALLDGLEAAAPMLAIEDTLFSTKQNAREADRAAAAEAVREAQARKAFLAELAKDTAQPPEVQAAVKDAQRRITEDLAARQTAERAETSPFIEVDFAQGTGKAQIKGRRIEQIDLQPATVLESPPSADSTDSPAR